MDNITDIVRDVWNNHVDNNDKYTTPWLNVTKEQIDKISRGELSGLHNPTEFPQGHKLSAIYRDIHGNLSGKKVLCLASGGGQQSVVYSLLGADVTVFDLNEKQLKSDESAARNYGYKIKTAVGDMRNLSVFQNESFDYIFQPISACFIPKLNQLYTEVYRVLKKGGTYLVEHMNPATYPSTFFNGIDGWDGVGYRISTPYICGPIKKDANNGENMTGGECTGEFRHSLFSIFEELIMAGFTIKHVWEDPSNLFHPEDCEPGSEEYFSTIIQLFINICCTK